MGDCCRGSSKKTSKGSRWLNWIGAGGFALVVVLLALFDGYPLVSQAAPLVLLALVVIWFAMLVARRLGMGR